MTVALLDVNVLIALFDPDHVNHEAAHTWFARNREHGWATCPITENAVVRILSNPAYRENGLRPAKISADLDAFKSSGHHAFWGDQVSLSDRSIFRLEAMIGHQQTTDVYLLGLAKHNHGRLATFDRSVALKAVHGASEEHRTLLPA